MKGEIIKFNDLLALFPEIPLPVTLSPETSHEFSRHNDVIPQLVSSKFLIPIEGDLDEFTEYIACCKIPDTTSFHAIIYWKGALMSYDYILATFTKEGELIDRKVIAGTKAEGDVLLQSVATIDEDWLIYVGEGRTDINADENNFDATKSKHYDLELLPNGIIK